MTLKKFTIAQLAELTKATLSGAPETLISGVDALDSATEADASFLANPRYRPLLKTTAAGVICVDHETQLEEGKNYLISDDPSSTFQAIVKIILQCEWNTTGFQGIHPTAVIHPSVKIGKDVTIGPYVVIDHSCIIEDQTSIDAHVFIGAGVHVGENCRFYPHVTIREKCIIGNRVILQPGAVIGSCGFGYLTDATGKHTKLEQLGFVHIEDDVEIGANTTIDRGRFKSTYIGKGTKIDNLVQIGHNVSIGINNIIVSQTGIAGSAKTGKNVVFGGQAGVVGHIEIADYVMVATRGGISKSITQPGKYAGAPVMKLGDYNKQQVHLRKITQHVEQIEVLKEQIKELEERIASKIN